jgi:hypothetical protein
MSVSQTGPNSSTGGKTSMDLGAPAAQWMFAPNSQNNQKSSASMDGTDNNSLSPENVYNRYSSAITGGPQALATGLNGLNQTSTQNGSIPTHMEQVQAQVPDYGPMIQSMQQYVQSMNDLLSKFGK